MATASGMTFRTTFEMVNLNKSRWERGTKLKVQEAFKRAGVRYLELIAYFLPKRTGFLFSAFDHLEAWTGKTIINRGAFLQNPLRKQTRDKKTGRFGKSKKIKQGAYLINRKSELALEYRIKKIERYFRKQDKLEADLRRRRNALNRRGKQDKLDKGAKVVTVQSQERAQRQAELFRRQEENFRKQLERIQKRKKELSDTVSRRKFAFRDRYRYTPGETMKIPNPAAKGMSFKERLKAKIPEYILVTKKGKKTKIDETDPANFVKRYREYYYHSGGKTLKTPTSGRPFSTPVDKIFTGSIKTKYRFQYNVDIRYYYLNDNFNMGRGTPWEIQPAIDSAFNIFLSRLTAELPPFTSYLYKIKTTLNGTRITKTEKDATLNEYENRGTV